MKNNKKALLTALSASALGAGACLLLDSRYNLQLTEHKIALPGLPEGFRGFKILHLSDLHGAEFGKDNYRLTARAAELRPELIALTGDFAQNQRQLKRAESLIEGLTQLAPVYFVRGNHEWAGKIQEETEQMLASRGARLLSNSFDIIERGGSRLIIAGAEDPKGSSVPPDKFMAELREKYPEDFVLLLGHRNYWVKEYPELPAELILSGHAHGGIIRLPGLGGLLNNNHTFGAEYESGLYYSGRFCMEVSRGLGNSVPIPRFLNRPEIVSIELT